MKSSVENIQSTLISKEENEQVFRLFGPKCQSLVTSIVQLYVTQGPDHQHWIKKDSGVMCFVKDNSRRNFFFRLYCLNRNKIIWEQEFYSNFEYKCPHNYFHMFEIDDCIAGLNFASEHEANTMRATVMEKLALKRQRREERKSRNSLQNKQPSPAINMSSYNNTNYKNNQPNSIPYGGALQFGKKDKRKPIKLTKDDISLPKDFVHISHVGWDPHKGFDVDVDDPQLRKFFDIAGVSDKQLKDKETRDFIYDFINNHGGLDAVNAEVIDTPKNIAAPTPPPVPARTAVNRTAPPPPPPTKVRPPPPQVRSQPPPRPDPIQNNIPVPPPINNVPAPPPPPPPMSAPQPPPMASIETTPKPSFAPDPRNALLESIRAGKALKPVAEVERKVSVGDSRGDLLHEIRQGIELKPVQNCQRPSSGPSCQENSLAEALSNALRARAFAIHSDSESDSGNSTDDEDEWEQDD